MARRLRMEAGTRIDGLYTLGSVIGTGGMATVYEAVSSESSESLAIKVIDVGEASSPEQFFNELVMATRVKHPNVVQVKDFGLLDSGAPFIVMERLRGQSLKQHLREHGPMALHEAVPLVLGALDALAVAHGLGIVHKDIKPANLFLSRGDNGAQSLVLLDFGIAGGTAEQGTAVMCTPRYAPPEIFEGSAPGPAYDVYQFALVLAEMLVGRPLVTAPGGNAAFVEHQVGIQLPGELADSVIADVLERALSRDPALRQPDARALRADLLTGTESQRIRLTAPPTLSRRRGPTPAAVSAPDDGQQTLAPWLYVSAGVGLGMVVGGGLAAGLTLFVLGVVR